MTMVNKKEKRKSTYRWLNWGICISLICSIIITFLYGVFLSEARRQTYNPIEVESNISWLYQNSYLLYRDLYNKVNHTSLNFEELYLPPTEGNEWIWDTDTLEKVLSDGDFTGIPEETDDEVISSFNEYAHAIDSYFLELETLFSELNTNYDYLIEDLDTGAYISNLPSNNIVLSEQFFYLSFLFDKDGNVTVGSDILGSDPIAIRKYANAVTRNNSLLNTLSGFDKEFFDKEGYDTIDKGNDYFTINLPKNCRVTYCISKTVWENMQKTGTYFVFDDQSKNANVYYFHSEYTAFVNTGIGGVLLAMLGAIFLLALFLPVLGEARPWQQYKVFRIPLEGIGVAVFIMAAIGSLIIQFAMIVADGSLINGISTGDFGLYIPHPIAYILVYSVNIVFVTAYFFAAWFLGICFREIRVIGIREYIRKRCVIYQIFPFLKLKILELYEAMAHFDVTKKANKLILKIVLVNAVIVFIIGSLWVGGFAIAVVYSLVLYFILRKYISNLQKKYGILLGAINKIAGGDLNVVITEDLGVFEPFKPQVIRIQEGFQKALDEEVRSQKMKTELITNVSHDLKTPLTAIITYVNLLKEPDITEEQRREYLDILSRKSMRLKVLIEDLFEVSKANSQNITLNLVDVDIINLVKQVVFEMSDKMADSLLDVRMNLPEQKIILSLDSQKTYRIYENLLGNIAKYAMKGTRVYIDAIIHDDELEITLKNITAEEIFVNADDLTERFVRGDASRNTEGSGLGLAIAKSFTELQNGSLTISIDGDLFKVTTNWKLKINHSND